MPVRIVPAAAPLRGEIRVPSDKSISHRAVLFAAMADGVSMLSGVLDAADVRSSIEAVSALGAAIECSSGRDGLEISVGGWGLRGPETPSGPIDCGNSGTTARLLIGVLAGYPVSATLIGDESLSRRPMLRVTEPLATMGARFELSEGGTLPVTVQGGSLKGADHVLEVASAQVKSALLIAGLRASGVTRVREPAPSRDHTERMLPAFGAIVDREDRTTVSVKGGQRLHAASVSVPADPSSAAFLAAAATLVPGSEVVLRSVCLDETRAGFLAVLTRMGAVIEIRGRRTVGGEEVGDLVVRHAPVLIATTVEPGEIPSLIDEVPVLAVVACAAKGETRFCSVGELRVKESDRFDAILAGLHAMGGRAWAEGDDLVVAGPESLHGACVSSRGDHRLAMAFAVAALRATSPVTIEGFEAVRISYPRFREDLDALFSAR